MDNREENSITPQQFLSEFLIRNLTGSVTGDDGFFPYRKGVELVLLFNKFGFKDIYPESMEGSRRIYTQGRIKQFKNYSEFKKLVEIILDPKEFYGLGITIENAVVHINEYLILDGYEVYHDEKGYHLSSNASKIVEHKTTSTLSHDFTIEQIDKCEEKLATGDYDGAITNARSLIEAVSIEIIKIQNNQEYKSDGNLINIFKDLKKCLNMTIDENQNPQFLIEIIQGMTTTIQGIAALTNRASDRHNRVYKPQKHHAKLAVNCAFSFCDFILESFHYQQNKRQAT
jgi:hypothetical protein